MKLTENEENLIKDILKIIGNDSEMEKQFAESLGIGEKSFGEKLDLIFTKLGNGRLTVES